MQDRAQSPDNAPMRSKHPPLPTAIRPVFWILRVFGSVVGLVSLALVVWFAVEGQLASVPPVFGLGLAFAVLTWLPPTSRWHLPLLAALGLVVAVYLQDWWVGAIVLAAVAWAVWSRRRVGPLPKELEVAETDAVMRNARRFVEAFEALRFAQVGAYRARIGPVRITVSLLLASDQESYASVTDAVIDMTSRFPDGRSLVTRNSNLHGLPDDVLANPAPGAKPAELVVSHQRALETLAEHGHFPTSLTAPELSQIAIDSELRMVEWMSGMARTPQPEDTAALWDRPDRAERIAAWHGGGDSP